MISEDSLRIIEIAAKSHPNNIASPWLKTLTAEVRRLQSELERVRDRFDPYDEYSNDDDFSIPTP